MKDEFPLPSPEDTREINVRAGSALPRFQVLLQTDEVVPPPRRCQRVDVVGLREAAMREQKRGAAPRRPQIKGERRAGPLRAERGERLPGDMEGQRQGVNPHFCHDRAVIGKAKLAGSADLGIQVGVAGPPVADAVNGRDRLVNPFGGGVDLEKVHDVRHGLRRP